VENFVDILLITSKAKIMGVTKELYKLTTHTFPQALSHRIHMLSTALEKLFKNLNIV
jgi:hypothetical protein